MFHFFFQIANLCLSDDVFILPGYVDNILLSHLIIPGLVGKVDFTVRHLTSATESFPSTWSSFTSGQQCIGNGAREVRKEMIRPLLCFFVLAWDFCEIVMACFFILRILSLLLIHSVLHSLAILH